MRIFMLIILIITTVDTISQTNDYSGLKKGTLIGAEYSWSDTYSSINIGGSLFSIIPKTKYVIIAGIFAGPAQGTYENDIPSGVILDYVRSDMSGTQLDDYHIPDESDGGFAFGGKLLLMIFLGKDFAIGAGPRVTAYSPQEISVLHESSDGNYLYQAYAQIPYRERIYLPGIESHFYFIPGWIFNYSLSFLPDNQKMHTLGVMMIL